MSAVRILGIGSPFGDDRLGWEVARHLCESGALAAFPAGEVAAGPCDRPGAALVERMAGAELVILVDAMHSGARPGTVRRLGREEIDAIHAPVSSHGLGVAEAIRLADALGELPDRLEIVAVEADPHGLSQALRQRAVEQAAAEVLELVAEHLAFAADSA